MSLKKLPVFKNLNVSSRDFTFQDFHFKPSSKLGTETSTKAEASKSSEFNLRDGDLLCSCAKGTACT